MASRPCSSYLGWEQWRTTVSPEEAQATWDHIAHSPNCSIAKAQRLLGYQPRYTSLQGVQEAVTWLIEQGIVQTRSGIGRARRAIGAEP